MTLGKSWTVALGMLLSTWGLETARAEDLKTTSAATLRARPGEKAPALTKIGVGQTVKVIERQGRWVKVSVGGRIGWVTRTQVADIEEAAPAAAEAKQPKRHNSKTKPKAVEEEVASAPAQAEPPPPRVSAAKKKKWSKNVGHGESVGGDVVASKKDKETRVPLNDKSKGAPAPVASAPIKKVVVGMAVVTARTTPIRQRPSAKAEELYSVDAGEQMKVILVGDDGAKWVRVQDSSGAKGWVETASLRTGGDAPAAVAQNDDEERAPIAAAPKRAPAASKVVERKPVAVARAEAEGESDNAGGGGGAGGGSAAEVASEPETTVTRSSAPRKSVFFIGAEFGFLSRNQTFTSQGDGLNANYNLNSAAPAISIGAGLRLRLSKPFSFVGDLGYMRSVGGNTITVGSTVLAWGSQGIEARAGIGWHLGNIMLVGRVGFHYAAFGIDDDVTAKLPSEDVIGGTVGLAVEAPHLISKFSLHASADMLLLGDATQTVGRRDGEYSRIAKYIFDAGVTYDLSNKLVLAGTYSLHFQGLGFGGADERETTAAGGKRVDLQHMFSLGVRYTF
jgi:uncharacterized protein YgiM (DUF1202 family)